MDTFPDGRTYLVDQVHDHGATGRSLHFVLPSGVGTWINIGNDPDTPEYRDGIAETLGAKRRVIKGNPIKPFPGRS